MMHQAAAVAAMNAIKANGVVVRIEAHEFLQILKKEREPLVVTGLGGLFKKHHQYLTSYKGLAFFTTSPQPLMLPRSVELIAAKTISIPDV